MLDDKDGKTKVHNRLEELDKMYEPVYEERGIVPRLLMTFETCLVSISSLGISGVALHGYLSLTDNQLKFCIMLCCLSLLGFILLTTLELVHNKKVMSDIEELESYSKNKEG